MNDKIYQLVVEILKSDLPKDTRNEIVRFFLLPRNTPILPKIEFDEEDEEVEGVDRPEAEEIELNDNPDIKAGLKETGKMLKKAEG